MSEAVANFEGEEVIMVTLIDSSPTSSALLRNGVRLLPVGSARWRVVARDGVVAGHLEARGDGAARRFRARRFHAATGAFRDVGEFWSAEEAVECLRLYR